ncbi:MAG: DUF5320 domain-containing protein [Phycisphaerae bacterium]
MPRFDGTGPQGKGPMTGKGMGFCVLKESNKDTGTLKGFAGINGRPVTKQHQSLFYKYLYHYFLLDRFYRFFRLINFRRNPKRNYD